MDLKTHWEGIYAAKQPHQVSWFQEEAALSLKLIRQVAPARGSIIDVGGGASTLVDSLLQAGGLHATVLDLSSQALAHAQRRLGPAAQDVAWIEGDVLTVRLPPAAFDLWHDRAVFHFLTAPQDRERYVAQVRQALRPGGHVLIATFASDGPQRCSGLNVVRYTPEALQAELGPDFHATESAREQHVTPAGAAQAFVYCLWRFEPRSDRAGNQSA